MPENIFDYCPKTLTLGPSEILGVIVSVSSDYKTLVVQSVFIKILNDVVTRKLQLIFCEISLQEKFEGKQCFYIFHYLKIAHMQAC